MIADGLRYEKKIGELLGDLLTDHLVFAGPWFAFEDANGTGFAQPDYLILPVVRHEGSRMGPGRNDSPPRTLGEYMGRKPTEDFAAVLECKRTASGQAMVQLHDLYLPLISHWWKAGTGRDLTIRHAQVCKFAPAGTQIQYLSLEDWWKSNSRCSTVMESL